MKLSPPGGLQPPETSPREKDERVPRAMRRYLIGLVAGAAATIGLSAGGMRVLHAQGALPPPAISNNLCMDEKLLFMRGHPPTDANLLVMGSSVAWRHFDGKTATAIHPGLRPYNAGLCGAQILQTAKVADWLLPRIPSARAVLLIASPLDFQRCDGHDPARFDTAIADDYVFDRHPSWRFYTRYFDPSSLLRNVRGLRQLRHDPTLYDTLVMDRFGDGPLMPSESRGIFYRREVELDSACFVALRRMAHSLDRRGVKLLVASTPLMPKWSASPGRQVTISRFDGGVRDALAGTGARYARPAHPFEDGDFVDAIHLHWSVVPTFTEHSVRSILASMDMPAAEAAGA